MSDTKKKNVKQWSRIKGENSWTMFKVIAEFVEGFETMNKIQPSISIFGSARTKPGSKYYELASSMAKPKSCIGRAAKAPRRSDLGATTSAKASLWTRQKFCASFASMK